MTVPFDPFEYYQKAVQYPASDIDIFLDVFRKTYDRDPLTIREDFCGTAYLSTEWVSTRFTLTNLPVRRGSCPIQVRLNAD